MKKVLLIALTIILVSFSLLISVFVANIPIIKLNGKTTEKIILNNKFKDSGAELKTLFGNKKDSVIVKGNVNTKKVGEYEIKYVYKYGLITKTVSRKIKVVDTEKPVINLIEGENVQVCPSKEYEELGYTATDNYDGDITNKVKIIKNNNLIKYKVKDSSGNKTIIERKIDYKDEIPPSISLTGKDKMSIKLGQSYNEPGYSALDNCDGDITQNVSVSNNININKVGNYEVKYKIVDKAGNETLQTRKVNVYQNQVSIAPGIFKSSMIYLTFDDGPSSTITPGVLDILRETGIKATFFVTNKRDSLNYLIKRAYDEGHTIALHTYSHNYAQVYQSDDAYFNDLYSIRDKVKNVIGIESNIIRFPGGSSNTVSKNYNIGIMSRLSNSVTSRGFKYFDWNVSSGDASSGGSKENIYNNVIRGISPTKTNVVLMHDFENNYKTLNALKEIIITCKNAGYTFDKIDSSTPQIVHSINN